jgi:hypothetical protein
MTYDLTLSIPVCPVAHIPRTVPPAGDTWWQILGRTVPVVAGPQATIPQGLDHIGLAAASKAVGKDPVPIDGYVQGWVAVIMSRTSDHDGPIVQDMAAQGVQDRLRFEVDIDCCCKHNVSNLFCWLACPAKIPQ